MKATNLLPTPEPRALTPTLPRIMPRELIAAVRNGMRIDEDARRLAAEQESAYVIRSACANIEESNRYLVVAARAACKALGFEYAPLVGRNENGRVFKSRFKSGLRVRVYRYMSQKGYSSVEIGKAMHVSHSTVLQAIHAAEIKQ